MRNLLAIAAVVASLGIASPPAHAQEYFVNGHAASPAEVRQLVSYGAQPGHWRADGYGISLVGGEQGKPAAAGTSADKCWYVLDVKLCG